MSRLYAAQITAILPLHCGSRHVKDRYVKASDTICMAGWARKWEYAEGGKSFVRGDLLRHWRYRHWQTEVMQHYFRLKRETLICETGWLVMFKCLLEQMKRLNVWHFGKQKQDHTRIKSQLKSGRKPHIYYIPHVERDAPARMCDKQRLHLQTSHTWQPEKKKTKLSAGSHMKWILIATS